MTKNIPVTEKLSRLRTTPKAAETRAKIIRGALDSLEDCGVGDVTTRRIAERAGINLATLHYHFDSKEALLLALLDELIARMIETFHVEIGAAGTLEERIETLIRSNWRQVERTRNLQIAQIELTLYALRAKGGAWVAERQYNAYIDTYRRMLFENVVELGIDSSIDQDRLAGALARFILSGIDGLILQSFALNDRTATDQGLEALVISSKIYLEHLRKR